MKTLWAAASGQLFGFTAPQLAAGGNIEPNIVLSAVDPDRSYFDLMLDAEGNLWSTVGSGLPGPIVKFDAADCVNTGAPVPSREVLTNTTGDGLGTFAFDHTNNLWVFTADGVTRSGFQKFSVPQYACSGTTQPCIEIGFSPRRGIQDCLFDHLGNLCFSDGGHGTNDGSICFLSPAQQLASNPTASPMVTWSGSNFLSPVGLVSGPTGLLWIADNGDGSTTARVKAFDPRAALSGNQAPIVTINAADFAQGVGDLIFDDAGNLWVMIHDAGILVRFDAASLASSGTKTPSVRIEVTSGAVMTAISGGG